MIELHTEAVVIGSGFGGSVVASRLIDQGVAVVMLERGPWRNTVPVESMNVRQHAELPRKSFGQTIRNGAMAVCHHRWPSARGLGINRSSGTFEAHFHKGFTSVATSQVGGGSLIYGGLIYRPLDLEYWNGVAEGVSEEHLASHFDRVKTELNTVSVDANELGFPSHLPASMRNNRIFELAPNADVTLAHKLPGTGHGNSPAYGIERRKSRLKESLSFGCLDGSKASTDAIYLGPALAKGLQLLSSCEVNCVQKTKNGGYRVLARNTRHKQSIEVHCRKLFMGAGAYNTVRLLMEAQRDGGLAAMPSLGKGIGNNGDDISVLLESAGGKREEDLTGLLTLFSLSGDNHRILHGIMNADMPQPRNKLMRRLMGPVLRSSFLVGMGRDLGNGVATLKKQRLQIRYEPRTQGVNQAVAQGNQTTAKTLGLKAIRFSKPITAHLFGGARVSRNTTEGVVDGLGECHQNPGLYVVDAAAIPKAPGTPPSLNIAAWASHVAEKAVAGCDRHIETSLRTDTVQELKRPSARKLAMLFSILPAPKPKDVALPAGQWTMKKLTAEHRRLKRHFERLFGNPLLLEFSAADCPVTYLKPQAPALNQAVLANSWDGSGLVYEVATAVEGQLITMQLRKLPDQPAWLARSANTERFLGWHLLEAHPRPATQQGNPRS